MLTMFRLYSLVLILALSACGGGSADVKAGTMPTGGSFTGVFHSPQYGEMHMIQTGDSVNGEYKKDERTGKINGSVEGDILHFQWIEKKELIADRPVETKGRGYFRYVVDASNGDHVLKGEWGIGDQETGGGPWNAWKSKHTEPKLSQDEGDSSEGEGFPDDSSDSMDSMDDDLEGVGESDSMDDDLF